MNLTYTIQYKTLSGKYKTLSKCFADERHYNNWRDKMESYGHKIIGTHEKYEHVMNKYCSWYLHQAKEYRCIQCGTILDKSKNKRIDKIECAGTKSSEEDTLMELKALVLRFKNRKLFTPKRILMDGDIDRLINLVNKLT